MCMHFNEKQASPCGIFCGACPKHAEEKSCRGCRTDTRHNICSIYDCCVTMGSKEFCCECCFFPCARLEHFVDYHPGENFAHYRHIAIENLKRIRETGISQWTDEIREQAADGRYCINRKKEDGTPDTSPCPCRNRTGQ